MSKIIKQMTKNKFDFSSYLAGLIEGDGVYNNYCCKHHHKLEIAKID